MWRSFTKIVAHVCTRTKPTNLVPENAAGFATNVAPPLRRKTTVVDLMKAKKTGRKISMVTAYSFPSAVHASAADIDCILVGDSVAMVELGHDTTLPVTMDQMLYHCKAVARGAQTSLLIGDMPFGSFETSPQHAYNNAIRFLKEAGMDAVKLEGGIERAETVHMLVQGGVAVFGHIGLRPQAYSVLGGFRAQGRTAEAALQLLKDAKALEEAGASALVIECVPAEVGKAVSKHVAIPVIGIGAGPYTDGQVLVYHDVLGMMEHEHYKKVSPKFCKQYASLGTAAVKALTSYREDVESGTFPSDQYSPYKMNDGEAELLEREFAKLLEKQEDGKRTQKPIDDSVTKVY